MTIRAGGEGDYDTFARLYRELALDEPVPSRAWVAAQALLIAERGGEVAGYAVYDLFRDVVYVRHLVTDPAHRRAGVARALLARIATVAREAGASRWCLSVKPDNVPRARYGSVGMTFVREGQAVRVPWSLELPGEEIASELAPEDDAETERRFDLYPGMLASRRSARPRLALFCVRSEGEIAAIAGFDRQFPGAFVFRARTLRAAGALLRARRAARVKIDDGTWRATHVQLFVEEPSLSSALVALGGAPILRVHHMRGPL